MTLALTDFSSPDASYVSKLNANNAAIEAECNMLEGYLTGAVATNASMLPMISRLFGSSTVRIGPTSLVASISGTTVVFTTGWVAINGSVVIQKTGSTTVDLTGLTDGTYHLNIDTAGNITADGAPTFELYSVVKTGSSLGTLTAVAAVAYTGPQPYDIVTFTPGTLTASQLMNRHVFARAVTLPISLTGSYASSTVTATATTTITLKKNGSSIGSIAFAGGASTGTFTFSAAVSFVAGDVLTVEAPGSADATLGNVSISLAGYR